MFLEDFIGSGFSTIVGDAALEGVLVLTFFGGFVLLQGSRLDHKVCILTPACILTCMFIPWLSVVLALVLGIITYLAFMKFTGR